MDTMHMLRFSIAAVIVVVIGALIGWYLFVSKQVAETQAADSARGFGVAPSFGSSVGGTYQNLSGEGGGSVSVSPGTSAPRLWQVSKLRVAGFGFSASSSRLYFAERSTGNVLSADASDSSVERVTKTLFPQTYEALFSSDGSVLLRSVGESGGITTFASFATTSAEAPRALEGDYLPENISAIAVRPGTHSLFFLEKIPGGGVLGFTSDWNFTKHAQVFSSALSGWRAQYLSDGSVYLTQKAMDGVDGYAFRLKGSAAESYFGPVQGLSILPRANSTALIYSSSGGGGTGVYARASEGSAAVHLSIHTIADKCVWAPGKDLVAYCAAPVTPLGTNFLRKWYDGSLHTTDTWWRVDVSSGEASKLFVTDSSLNLDVREPAIDPSGQYLAFRDGADESLWVLRIAP